MMQYSVYVRHCASGESVDVHEKRIHKLLPPLEKVSILRITDKQFGNILNFLGKAAVASGRIFKITFVLYTNAPSKLHNLDCPNLLHLRVSLKKHIVNM
ncbi:hypothetical protein GCM10011518_42830 [Flavobacterium limi]|uniref:Uncharacterized protein n=2 Tax=Flavobacterium limi TaxID=2045105 RepID=A0ABQ1UY39_9FLAO|nr:hypothetical protein GCM10011518_42830 [Flavobacterium limi]